jgi:hypothetical protein
VVVAEIKTPEKDPSLETNSTDTATQSNSGHRSQRQRKAPKWYENMVMDYGELAHAVYLYNFKINHLIELLIL